MWELTDQHGVYKMLRLAGRTKTFSCCLQTIGHQTTKLQKKEANVYLLIQSII